MTKESSKENDGVEADALKRPASDNKPTTNGGSNGENNGLKKAPMRMRHPSQDSEVSIESMEEYIPTPPDGGWGWVIVCSSMMCNLIVDGIGYSFGVFLSEFVDAFNEPKSKVSLVGSLLCGTYLFAGPVVSAMTNKYGCRPVVIVGSCIATVAFILARFSPNIIILILTYGVIGGFGLGMVYLPSIVSVGYYFEKKRAFATGLAVCGSGLGTFIFPPLSKVILAEYSWQGGLLIIAAIIFNGCICGALMRPLKAEPVHKSNRKPRAKNFVDRLKETTRDRSISENSNAAHSAGSHNKTQIQEKVMFAKLQREQTLEDTDSDMGSLPSVAFVKRGESIGGVDRRFSEGIPIPLDPRRSRLSASSTAESGNSPATDVSGSPASRYARSPANATSPLADLPGSNKGSQQDGHISPDSDSEVRASDTAESTKIVNDSSSTDDYYTPPVTPASKALKDLSQKGTPQNTDNTNLNGNPQPQELIPLIEVAAPVIRPAAFQGGSRTNMMNLQSLTSLHISKKDLARPLYRKDIFYSGSVLNIPQFRSQPDMKSYITSITTIPGEMEFVDGPSPSSRCINKFCDCLPRPARDILSEMADVSLFRDISFMLICLGNVLAFLGFYVPFVFLVDLSVSLNIDKTQATFLISIIGITNTVGRVIIGKLADLHIVDSLVITYVSIAICGVTTGLVPLCTTYPLLAANAAVFGLGMAAYISLSSIIICDRMGLDKLTNAFGLLSMVRGIAAMGGPPLAGFMYDSSGSYNLSFFMGGLLLLVGAACHVLLHLPALRPKRQELYTIEEVTREEVLQIMGSRPQIVSIEEAISSA